MEKNQPETRHFLITHKKESCQSEFTIDSNTFLESYRNDQPRKSLRCPNCDEILMGGNVVKETVIEFLDAYNNLIDYLKSKDVTIIEIQPEEPSK